jgi:N-acyl homoserine lactone hydrolase
LPSIDIVLRGMSLTSNEGNFAPCAVYLVRGQDSRGQDRSILYDFGHVGRRLKLQAALARRGLRPEEIDWVVLSHAHWDHMQNIDLFSNASAVVHAKELAYMKAPHPADHATPIWSRHLLDTLTVQAGEEGDELIPGVRVLHLPGHTPGSIGLAVTTDAGTAVISGDALASAADAVAGRCPNVFWDPEQSDASVRRVVELADVCYPGHDRPFARVTGDAVPYLTEVRQLTLSVRDLATTSLRVVQQDRPSRSLWARAADEATRAADEAKGAEDGQV